MLIEQWPIDKPVPYARNARKLSGQAVDKVAASLKEFGWQQPLVVDKDGVLIVGHTRLMAAKKLGMTEVPVLVAHWLTPAQVKAYRLMDNRSHQETDWDFDLLGPEFAELKGLDFELSLTGFDLDEITALEPVPAGLTDEDAVPEVPVAPVTRPGDLWLLGRHRVLCGDSTSIDAVERLMGGEKAAIVLSDPPYGIDFDTDYRRFTTGFAVERHAHAPIHGDAKPFDPTPWLGFADHVILWGANCYSERLPMGTWLVWDKRHANGTAFLADAEVAWMRGGHGVYIYAQTWQGCIRSEEIEHPTQKPLGLMRWCLGKSKTDGIILDPYLGSGTTLIAAEVESRVCCGAEIEPKYVDVIVQRWQDFTGKEATLEGHGATFAHVKEGRLLGEQDAIKEEIFAQ
jgi:DNA methylase/ParB-like nuclease family protein